MLGLGNSLTSASYIGFTNTYSLDFDGTNDYVDCGVNTHSIATFSLSLWFSCSNATDTTNNALITFGDSNTAHFTLSVYNQEIYTTYENGSGDVRTTTDNLDLFENDEWYHLVCSNSSGTLTWYVNGSAVTVATSQTLTAQSCGDLFEIGRNDNKSANFNGNIDEVAIWNTALSAGSVSNIYNNGVPTDLLADSNSANLQGWWRMGDGTLDDFNLIADQVNPTLATEEINDGDFTTTGTQATDTQGAVWETETGWTIASGKATLTNPASAGYDLVNSLSSSNDNTAVAGKIYKCQYEIESLSASSGTATVRTRIGSVDGADHTTTGIKTDYILATATNAFRMRSGSGFTGTLVVKNITVKAVNGNPGLMTNMASDDIVKDTP